MYIKQFFELLRSGLWKYSADVSLFTDNQILWDKIYTLSRQQAVLGLVFDGIQTLPTQLHPSKQLHLKWSVEVIQIEDGNKYLNKIIRELFLIYQQAGLSPILLKGQGIASLYNNPDRRQFGDIDIYIGTEQFDLANQLIKENGGEENGPNNFKHASFMYKGASVENHRYIERPSNPRSRAIFFDFINKELKDKRSSSIIENHNIQTPSLAFNAAYILIHALYHHFRGGVGLRQLCDWSHVLNQIDEKTDLTFISELFEQMKIYNGAKSFAYIATDYLGLRKDRLSFLKIENMEIGGEKLLQDILRGGNFGQYEESLSNKPLNFWKRKKISFFRTLRIVKSNNYLIEDEAFWYISYYIKDAIKRNFLNKIRAKSLFSALVL